MKIDKKHKKTYLLIIFVFIIYFTLIACIINDCRQITQDYVAKYKLHIEKISNLEDDPLALAEEFMQSKYDKHWNSLKGCWGRISRDMIGYYELGTYIVSGKSATRFYKELENTNKNSENFESTNIRVICNAYVNDKSEFDNKDIIIVFNYDNSIQSITVNIKSYGPDSPETVIFNINLTDGNYVADEPNAEELTSLTIEEIVETAELNQKGFEDLMYAMKEHELEESKNELDSGLKCSYTIATLLIVALLSLWITVSVAMIKFMTKKKASASISIRQRDKT